MEINLNNLSNEHSKILNQIWKDGISDYNRFYDSRILEYSNDLNYLLSGVATRDVYLSRIYESICYLKLLKKISQEKRIYSVKVKNLTIEKMLKADPELKKIRISFSIKKRIQELILIPVAYFLNIYRMIKEFILVRFYICNYDIPNEIILFDSFLIESSFSGGRFNDIYYPGLQELIREKSKVFYLFTILLKKYRVKLLQLKNSNIRFIHRYQFLKLSDLCLATIRPFFMFKYLHNKRVIFEDIDITKAFRYELIRTSVAKIIFDSILNYRFIFRLKQKSITVNKFIDWFENQQTDRGYSLGLRQFYENVEYFGCLGSLSFKTQFHLYPTKAEFDRKLTPGYLFVVGKNLIFDYSESCKELKLDTMPAFRYAYLFQKDGYKEDLKIFRDSGEFKILVTLPMELNQALKILKTISNIRIFENYNISFYLKFHPTYSLDSVEKLLRRNKVFRFPILNDNIKDCLVGKQLLISSVSSTCLESLAFGIPVLVIASNGGVTHLPFSENITKEIWDLCYDEKETLEAIFRFVKNYDYDRFKSIGEKIKKENFTKLDHFSLKRFTNLVF
ncbi:hypothetical protein [Leptospira borgpetersenii]|uniref:Capsule polysaccharide biosynthesis protein n=1 Tax=Leptospira borgpetersenii serovar Javanica str. UI 09931 TaxID=1049767 RepID=A0AAV3J6Y0_LEPBO|nr:hypothetical protein [Leptospira borgpetersenii]AXX16224.1 hypothetical protein C4Q31_12295 [Leptospira borgpetersenii serovar Ceylonica]EKQ90116.1 hypothetical protein LEP1GSC101_2301 [Leptospira borgpetersenii str. UI 09149]EKR00645.1 hypothetical protein LEP1GSC121_1044 [Leptospira borgpetersenii serovar Castellonis str. 200801910]EMN58578.1 hypothetical protein LEP1GSC090_0397 [Leptospira borgpetersenii serovar Javanica str. MK146]EPG56336.1 hypothetical protein LEP1GSC103_1408 [Leptosp